LKLLRELPPIHQIQDAMLKENIGSDLSQKLLKQMVQQEVNELRSALIKETYTGHAQDRHGFQVEIIASVQEKLTRNAFNLVPVINATGVVLHTNLGRARLSDAAIDHMIEVAKSYSTLEYNLTQGRRGSRQQLWSSITMLQLFS
jgi:L-seryl-tRNA(Ser) seleniumtransferase